MELVLKTKPTSEPILLADAKAHCNITTDEDDSYITKFLIPASREFVEQYIKGALLTQTWVLHLDQKDFHGRNYIYLPKNPVQSIVNVKTFSDSNVEISLNPDNYYLLNNRVTFHSGSDFYGSRYLDSTAVEFIAGYSDDPIDIPSGINLAMLELICHWYENREAIFNPLIAEANPGTQEIRLRLSALLAPYAYKMIAI